MSKGAAARIFSALRSVAPAFGHATQMTPVGGDQVMQHGQGCPHLNRRSQKDMDHITRPFRKGAPVGCKLYPAEFGRAGQIGQAVRQAHKGHGLPGLQTQLARQ